MKLVHHPPGVAAAIGWIVPCAVIHDTPRDELSSRIMAVAIVVEVELSMIFEAKTEKESCRERHIALGVILKAERSSIGRLENTMILADRGGLIIEVDMLRSRLSAGAVRRLLRHQGMAGKKQNR